MVLCEENTLFLRSDGLPTTFLLSQNTTVQGVDKPEPARKVGGVLRGKIHPEENRLKCSEYYLTGRLRSGYKGQTPQGHLGEAEE